MKEVFKWCFIGTGALAKQVADELKKSGRHEIVSCYTRNYEKCKAFAREYSSKAYESAEEAILAEGVDAVYVVTPHNAHYRYTKLALELGKPVLCEKAFTITAQETDELISLAREKELYLCEAMWTWFSQGAVAAKKWIDEGKIGAVSSALFTFHMKASDLGSRLYDPRRAGGALLDITIYPITYAYRLWGKPLTIESTATIEGGVDTADEIIMHFANGVKAEISASIKDYMGFERMTIKGERGIITAPLYHAFSLLTCCKGLFRRERFISSKGIINKYLEEFDIVADEIRRGLTESEYVPLQCTSDVMHLLDTVRAQIGLCYDQLD